MNVDASSTKETKRVRVKARGVLTKLSDPYVVLGMTCLLLLLDNIDHLVLFATKRDVFICDFVAALQVCLGQLYKLYVDSEKAFDTDEFWSFKQLLQCSHKQIYLKWVLLLVDLNATGPGESAHLAFVAGDYTVKAMHEGQYVTQESFAQIVSTVKAECKGAAELLIHELKSRFLADGVMDALGVVYPQQTGCELTFHKHLDVIKKSFGEPRWIHGKDGSKLVPPLLDCFQLECQQALFKLFMLSNSMTAMKPPFLLNPLTKLWRCLDANSALATSFSEYVKLAEIAMIHVLGFVEDERCFSALSFLKDKVRNRLDSNLSIVVGMKAHQVYTLSTFLYEECFQQWTSSTRYGITG